MKTVEEAIDSVIIKESAEQKDQHKAFVEKSLEQAERVLPVVQEVTANESVQAVLEQMFHLACCPKHAMQQACELGLRIGIEMERSETGGVSIA